jgi:hypothetical protein
VAKKLQTQTIGADEGQNTFKSQLTGAKALWLLAITYEIQDRKKWS